MFVIWLLLLGLLASGVYLLYEISKNVQVIRYTLLPDIRAELLRRNERESATEIPRSVTYHGTPIHGGRPIARDMYCVWEWSCGDWKLRSKPEGVDPGLKPKQPGKYERETVKIRAVVLKDTH